MEPAPNLSSLPPALQQHVLNIAYGLQSSDPRNGLYIMLQPFGIDRNAVNVQISREQINIGSIDSRHGKSSFWSFGRKSNRHFFFGRKWLNAQNIHVGKRMERHHLL